MRHFLTLSYRKALTKGTNHAKIQWVHMYIKMVKNGNLKESFTHESYDDKNYSGGNRSRPRRVRGGFGVRPHGGGHGAVHSVPGSDRQHALQSLHRRHRQRTFGLRNRRFGRRNGALRRCRYSAKPHSEPGKRGGSSLETGAGGPGSLPRSHEAYPGADAKFTRRAGRNHRNY